MASKKWIIKGAVKSAVKAWASSYLKNKASWAQKKADFYQKMRDKKQQSPSYKWQYFGYREYEAAANNQKKKAAKYNKLANKLSK